MNFLFYILLTIIIIIIIGYLNKKNIKENYMSIEDIQCETCCNSLDVIHNKGLCFSKCFLSGMPCHCCYH